MFCLTSNINIGRFRNVKPIEVKVTRSMRQYNDTAIVKLPIVSRIMNGKKVVEQSVDTAKQFREGDAVRIVLGYTFQSTTTGNMQNHSNLEFEGFIARVNFTSPLEIECEGYSYQLRKRTYTRTFVKAELLEILKYLVQGTDIVLDEKQIASFVVDKLVLQQHSGTEALDMLKKISHDLIFFIFSGRLLYAGLLGFDYKQLDKFPEKPAVSYRLGWNVIKDNNLKRRQATNQDVTIHFVGEKKDGTKERVTVNGKSRTRARVISTSGSSGANGETKVIKTHAVTDASSLQKLAEAAHLKSSYDGYEGKITAFLLPFCEPAYRIALEDPKYKERSGRYLVESTEVTYGLNGARRIVGLGLQL